MFYPSDFFIGREDELQILADILISGTNCPQCKPDIQRVIINGPGGIGKSALASEFCRRFYYYFDGVCWLHCDQDFADEIAQAGESMHLPGWPETLLVQMEKTLAILRNNPRWLVILDNMNNELVVSDWMNRIQPARAIVLTRLKSLDQIPDAIQLQLNPLADHEALLLLWQLAPAEYTTHNETDRINWLTDFLGHQPVLIALMARLLCNKSIHVETSMLKKRLGDTLSNPSKSVSSLPPNNTLNWKVPDEWTAFSNLSELLFNDQNPSLKYLFIACGYCAPEFVLNIEVLSRVLMIDPTTCRSMLYKLADFGLLVSTSNGLVISPRIADYARYMGGLEKVDILQNLISAWDDILNGSLKTVDVLLHNYTDIAHLKAALIAAISNSIEDIGFMMYFLGRHYQQKKAYPLAEFYLMKALELDKKQYGLDHLKVGIILDTLGNLLYQEHKLFEANACYSNALPILKRNFNRDHPLVIALQNKLEELDQYFSDEVII